MGLTSDFWVAAYLARLEGEGVYAHVAHKGDPTAGAIAVKLATMDGKASLFTKTYDADGQRIWDCRLDMVEETEVDSAIERQRGFDRDLWVIEVESPSGRHLLDQDGLG